MEGRALTDDTTTFRVGGNEARFTQGSPDVVGSTAGLRDETPVGVFRGSSFNFRANPQIGGSTYFREYVVKANWQPELARPPVARF